MADINQIKVKGVVYDVADEAARNAIKQKQNILIPGNNITIKDNVISANVPDTEGAVTGIIMNGKEKTPNANGMVDLGTVVTDISGKVDKEDGKGLFSGSYDDLTDKPQIPQSVTDLNDAEDYVATEQLNDKIDNINNALSEKANINDMSIESGNGSAIITLKRGVSATVLTQHQDISGKADKSEMSVDAVTGDSTKKKVTIKQGLDVDVVTEHQSLANYPTKSEMNIAIQQSAGQDGKSAYQVAVDNGFIGSEAEWLASLHGADGVASADDVYVVNNYNGVPADLPQGKVAVLGAGLGTSIGKVFNVNTADTNNATPYRLWVGTAEQLEALEANDGIEDDVIYLIGTVPTPAVKYNVTFNGTNCSSNVSAGQKVKENTSLEVEITPNTNYTIDTISVVMGSTTLNAGTDYAVTDGTGGKKTITIDEVTAAVSISASASVHINSLVLNADAQDGNIIGLSAAVTPNTLTGVTHTWSIPANTTKFSISGSGNTAAVNLLNGAQAGDSVVVTCVATNSEGTSTVTQTITVTATSDYVNNVPITALGAVSYQAATAVNTYQFSVEKTPADGNIPAIEWSVASTPNGAATINSATGLLTITDDCSVVVTASSGQNSSSSSLISLTYQLSGTIQFEDWKAKGLALYMVGKIAATATKEEIEADTQIKYENVAGLERVVGRDVPTTYLTGERAVEYFNEAEYFKSWHLNPSNWPKLREFTYDGDNEDFKDISASGETCTNNPKLVKLKLPNNLDSLAGTAAGGPINTLAAIQVLDLSNTQLVNLTTGQRLFNSCSKLKTIIMPPTLQNFTTEQVARYVSTLQYVVFTGKDMVDLSFVPYTVSSINLVFTSTVVPVGITAIPAKTDLIYVPDAKFDLYKAKSPFSTKYSSGKLKKISELPANWNKTVYSVTTSNATNSNDTSVVEYKSSYQATLSSDGSSGSSTNVKVVMDGEDVTSTVYDVSTHTINITKVLGDIVIDGNYVEPETTE